MIGLNVAKLFRALPRWNKRVLVGLAVWFVLAGAACPVSPKAQIKRIVIEDIRRLGGKIIEGGGFEYSTIRGKVYGEVDPKDRRNEIINDIDLAPRNARGMVEYVATFTLSMPKDLSKASGVLFYLVPNRGLRHGSGDLPARGHIILSSGWQGDLGGDDRTLESITVPFAKNKDGSSITGPVVTRFTDLPAGTKTLSLPTHFCPGKQ